MQGAVPDCAGSAMLRFYASASDEKLQVLSEPETLKDNDIHNFLGPAQNSGAGASSDSGSRLVATQAIQAYLPADADATKTN